MKSSSSDLASPTVQSPQPFRFLALPYDVRKLIYEFIFVSDQAISLDKGSNLYYKISLFDRDGAFISRYPSGRMVTFAVDDGPPPQDPLALTIAPPANFLEPPETVVPVRYRERPTAPVDHRLVTNIIPLANVTQPPGLRPFLRVRHLPADVGPLVPGNETYIGPVETSHFSYLPPNTYAPTLFFNARLLRVCKAIHSEALPILYTQNKFVMHAMKDVDALTVCVTGRPLRLLRHLRINVLDSMQLSFGRRRLWDDDLVWDDLFRRLNYAQTIELAFQDRDIPYARHLTRSGFMNAIFHFAHGVVNVAEWCVPRPSLFVRVKTTPFGKARINNMLEANVVSGRVNSLPSGCLIELVGILDIDEFNIIRRHTKNYWHFKEITPESADTQVDSWAKLEWVKDELWQKQEWVKAESEGQEVCRGPSLLETT